MTHGGVYGHFDSKDDLVNEACTVAFERSVERWHRRVADATEPTAARAALIEAYVSKQARNAPGTAFPAAALAGDVAREPASAAVRSAYATGVDELIAVLTQLEPGEDAAARRRAALADFALMVGSVVLARATQGMRLSDEVLDAGRERLLSGGARPARPGKRS